VAWWLWKVLNTLFFVFGLLWRHTATARSVEDETRNAELNGNRNPEWWWHFSQLVKIEKIKFLGISRYKVELRFWLDLNSEVSSGTNSNWDVCLIWICSWLKSPHHSGFQLPFNSAFRVSSSTERAVATQFDRKKPPPPGGFPIYYVPSSRTVCKRTPLKEPGTNPWRGALLHTVLDEGT